MRLPWMSRADHLAEVARALTVAASERENAQALRMENMELSAKYHELVKRLLPFNDGTAPLGPPPEKVEPSPIAKLIREQASEAGTLDYALAAHLRKYARSLKEQGLSEDQVMGKLVEWQNTESMFTEQA